MLFRILPSNVSVHAGQVKYSLFNYDATQYQDFEFMLVGRDNSDVLHADDGGDIIVSIENIVPIHRPERNYFYGDVVLPNPQNGYLYRCILSGKTGVNPPIWRGVQGAKIQDGAAVWLCVGRVLEPRHIQLALNKDDLNQSIAGAPLVLGREILGGVANARKFWARVQVDWYKSYYGFGDGFDTEQNLAQIIQFKTNSVQSVLYPDESELLYLKLGYYLRTHRIRVVDIKDIIGSNGKKNRFRMFGGDDVAGLGDFDLLIYIDNQLVNQCGYGREVRIRVEESAQSVAEFLLNLSDEKEKLDLYQWHGKTVYIDVANETKRIRLFTGWVEGLEHVLQSKEIKLICTNRREEALKSLTELEVRSIGYWTKSVFGETNGLVDELSQRMQTIPASLDCNVFGQVGLNWWKPKETADFVLEPCFILDNNPTISISDVGQVLNAVDVRVSLSYPRLLQRAVHVHMATNLNVCQYYAHHKLPTLHEIHQTLRETGWGILDYQFERTEPSGFYRCGNVADLNQGLMGWIRSPREAVLDEEGKIIGSRYRESYDVVSGWANIVKRWEQQVTENYILKLRNFHSISRYGEKLNHLSYSVSVEKSNGVEWLGVENKEDDVKYNINHRTFDWRYNLPTVHKKSDGSDMAQRAENGDIYIDIADSTGEFNRAMGVAYRIAYVQILDAHRQNTVDFQCLFLPEISVFQTHQIDHSHFKGKAKVSAYEHVFDLEEKEVQTNVQYLFFQNSENGEWTDFEQPPRFVPSFAPVAENRIYMGLEVVDVNEEIEEKHGFIYLRSDVNRNFFTPLAWRCRAPEIEKESTDGKNEERAYFLEVGVFNDDVEVWQ